MIAYVSILNTVKAHISLGSNSGVIGWKFVPNQSLPGSETLPYPGTSFADILLSHDAILAPLFGPREGTPFVDVGALSFDFAPSGLEAPSELLPTPVHSRKYDFQFDETRNASILHRLFEFLHSGIHPRYSVLSNENLGFQATYRGSLVSKIKADNISYTLAGYYPFGLGHAGQADVRTYVSSHNNYGCLPGGPFLADYETNVFHFSYKDYVTKFSDLGESNHTDPLRYSTDFDVNLVDNGYAGYRIAAKIKCQFFGTFGSVACTYRWRYVLDILGFDRVEYINIGPHYRFGKGPLYYPDRRDVYNVVFEYVTCDSGSMDVSVPNLDSYLYGIHPIIKGSDLSSEPSSLDVVDHRRILRDKSYDLSDRCFRDLHNLKDASYLSTVDSVNDMQRGTSSDVLQTLAKLPDAASMIPKIREFIAVCEDIRHRRFNISTLKDLAGLAATTNLQSNFQWQPFQRFLTDQLPEVVRGISEGWTRSPYVVGRGKYSYVFNEGLLGYPSARLTARSKIVVDTSISSVFATVLGLDGLGIMPKPSNLWDLIPFSFVVNWMTGVGASIRNAENGLFLMVFPTYGVHTLTIEASLTTKDLDTLKLSSDPLDPFSLRWYHRDVSLYIPLPTSGKYPFGLPTGSPSITLIASLLYSLIVG